MGRRGNEWAEKWRDGAMEGRSNEGAENNVGIRIQKLILETEKILSETKQDGRIRCSTI